MNLESLPITRLKGVGNNLASTLAKLGITTVQDMLFHLPHRYVDKTRITPIAQLQLHSSAVIQGRVLRSDIKFGRRRSLAVSLEDNSGSINLRFFYFSNAQKNRLSPGTLIRCFGDARQGASGLEMYHPEYEFVDDENPIPPEQTLTPVYHLTEGITQARLSKLTEQAIKLLEEYTPCELLPPDLEKHFEITSLGEALKYLHSPPAEADVESLLSGTDPRQQRLAFEELLAHFLARQHMRAQAQSEQAAKISISPKDQHSFLQQFSFSLTGAQEKVIKEILIDLQSSNPMLRMIQGDVGSGKTLVAAVAALHAANSDYQIALVAPTEILAEQHVNNFKQWFAHTDSSVDFLVSKLGAAKKRSVLERIAEGKVKIVIGTHALFQNKVVFSRLGLVIIDEQHRFGVDQRKSLRDKTPNHETPHQLIMTATPIPRTLAMTAYSEMDYSVIDELPAGRTPVSTALVSQQRRNQVIERIRSACAEGKQAYWVCTLIENSETLSAANAEETCEQLQASMPEVKVKLIHGKLKPADKDSIMQSFKCGETQLLVATTVIEVGVDVPKASLMIIENPERLGLAQLHQLRGRVGRGDTASYCVLLYGDALSKQAKERLQVMRQTSDGFVIAEKDLQLRGPGELLGTRQTGDMEYRLADVLRDAHMLPLIHETGKTLLKTEPGTVSALLNRWFGGNQEYARI